MLTDFVLQQVSQRKDAEYYFCKSESHPYELYFSKILCLSIKPAAQQKLHIALWQGAQYVDLVFKFQVQSKEALL